MPVAEAARLLGCTPRTVHRHIEAGDIRAVRLGERGAWRVVRGSIEAMIQAEPVVSRYGVREAEPNAVVSERGFMRSPPSSYGRSSGGDGGRESSRVVAALGRPCSSGVRVRPPDGPRARAGRPIRLDRASRSRWAVTA